jgi:hypothetical protein
MSPRRVSSPRKVGARPRVKGAASQEKTPGEKKTRSKALTCNETNQEATKLNQGRMAAPPCWRSNAMEKSASLSNFDVDIENWDSDSDSSAPNGGNQADAFVVVRKSDIAKPKSEKKLKNTKRPDKLAKIAEATELNQKKASRRALGARRTNNNESEASSEKNSIKSPSFRKIKFIRKSETEQGAPEIEIEVGPMDDISAVTHDTKYTAKSKRKGSSRTLEAPSL